MPDFRRQARESNNLYENLSGRSTNQPDNESTYAQVGDYVPMSPVKRDNNYLPMNPVNDDPIYARIDDRPASENPVSEKKGHEAS